MKLNPRIQRLLKLWAPPLISILAMVLLAQWVAWARFLLFGHHLFWMAAFILLLNPIIETFSPGRNGRSAHQPSSLSFKKARPRPAAPKGGAKPKPAPASETPAERLAHLQKKKEVVDQKIEKLTAQDKKQTK